MWSTQTQLLKRTFGLILDIVAPIQQCDTLYWHAKLLGNDNLNYCGKTGAIVNKPVFKKKRPPKPGVLEEIFTTFFTPVPQKKTDHRSQKIN